MSPNGAATGGRDDEPAGDPTAPGSAPAAAPGGTAAGPATPVRTQSVPVAELDRVLGGAHPDPHSVLGAHLDGATVTIRALRPLADSVTAVLDAPGSPSVEVPLEHEHEGIWVGAATSPVPGQVPDYRLVVDRGGVQRVEDDAYRHLPTVGEVDQYLIGEGRHEQLWDVLGANEHTYASPGGPVSGVSFAVWAPNARGVRVVGDFNRWDARVNPMRRLGASGVWELFVPGVGSGDFYKFEVLGADSVWRTKADPMAKWTGSAPDTASRVFVSTHEWSDAAWYEHLAAGNPYTSPMSTYEVHLGSWRLGLDYRGLADELTAYVVEQGFTHVEFLPVAEHPFGGSWGYQVTSYYAPMSALGDPDDFRYLVDRLHGAGIGVLVDWVPGHFPRDEWALARFDGTPLYEHPDPRRGEQPDWGTYVFDFGRHEVRNFLVANALYWLDEFHVDGLRVDAVASMLYLDYSRAEGEWVPNAFGGRENLEAVAFLQETNATVYRRHPTAVTIAEESTAWPGVTRPTDSGGLGFGFKWNMGWMHDSLAYVAEEPVYRQYHHGRMTFSMVYAYSENFVLPISHDEVVHGKGSLLGKMPGDRWRQFANLRAFLGYMWAHPGKQLLFMGSEFAHYREWSETRGLDWELLDVAEHAGVQHLVRDLNHVYTASPALHTLDHQPTGFSWIDADDASANVLSFLRFGSDGSTVASVSNFSPVPHHTYRIGLPRAGRWVEVVNSDASVYGGSGMGNHGSVHATDESWFGFPASASIVLPPLATVWFRHDGD